MSRFLRVKLSLYAKIISQVCVNWTQPIHHRDSRRLKVSLVGLRTLDLALKAFLLAISKAKVASSEGAASQGETTALVLPLEANLALLRRAFSESEVRRVSLLALNSALPLTSRQSLLAPGAESNARSTMLVARTGVVILASREGI